MNRARFAAILKGLQDFTATCNDEMHEPPDDMKVSIVGDHLDNAFGNVIRETAIREGYQEFVIVLRRFDEPSGTFPICAINLSDLIALARKADLRDAS